MPGWYGQSDRRQRLPRQRVDGAVATESKHLVVLRNLWPTLSVQQMSRSSSSPPSGQESPAALRSVSRGPQRLDFGKQMTTGVEHATGSVAEAVNSRIAFLDNARFWAMGLVVIGHALFYFVSLEAGRAIYYWIFLFHMPLFVMLSGYISRNFSATPGQIQRAVSTLVIPYLLVESLYQVLQRYYTGRPDPYTLLSPQWVAWFLAALLVWRLSTPIWRHLKHPILISILISLLVPLTEIPNVMALPKVLGMLPFYVIGMHMTLERFERLAKWRVRAVSVTFLAAVGVACATFSSGWALAWTKWRDRYDEEPLLATPIEGAAIRALLIVVGVLMCMAVLSLIPWGKSWTSSLGSRTLYSYLLHGFVVVLIARQTPIFDALNDLGDVGIAITIVTAAALAIGLMTRPVERLFRPFFEPNLNWAFRATRTLPG